MVFRQLLRTCQRCWGLLSRHLPANVTDRQQAIADAQAGEVIVVSYGLVTRLAETLQAKEWQTVVLDEAQQIKNPNAERAKVVFDLNAQRRIALSGTPVEDHLVELWSQFTFSLTRLRQVCCDPSLVFEHLTESSSKQKEARQLVVDAQDGGHNILVFSQFVQLLKRFGQQLTMQRIDFCYLDGQYTSKQRQSAINTVKSGKHRLFLINLKAGGSGLNLTKADTVIHLDPWWNPAVEDQASDHAYRMGQTKPVTVYRLVTVNTVEEKIIQLHSEKRDLADKVSDKVAAAVKRDWQGLRDTHKIRARTERPDAGRSAPRFLVYPQRGH